MTTIHNLTQQTEAEPVGRVRRVLLGMMALLVLPLGQYVFLAIRTGAWQLWVVAGVILVYLLGLLVGRQLLQRGHWINTVHLIIHGLGVSFIGYTLVVSGAGAASGLLTVVAALTISSLTLPARAARITMSVSIGLGVLNVLFDLFLPPYRLEVQDLQTIVPLLLIVVLVGFGVAFVRQFTRLPFPTKLLVVLLGASVIPVAIIASYANLLTRSELLQAASRGLANRAELQASIIGENLIKQAELLQTLALNNILEDETQKSSETHAGTPDAIKADLLYKASQWNTAVAARDFQNPLVQVVVANQAVAELREFTSQYPELVDVVVTDRYGALVAAETPDYDYFNADQEWWKAANNDGKGNIYFGEPTPSATGSAFGLPIALPIRADGSEEVIGVIRITYKAEAILQQVGALEFEASGHLDLILPNKSVLTAENTESLDSHFQNPAAANASTVVESLVDGVPSFAISEAVHSVDPEEGQYINQLGWRVLAHQSRAEVLQPLDAQTRTVLLITILITVVVAGIAFTLSQALMQPISRLTTVAEKVAGGNLDITATIESNDEFGTLARTFNSMTTQLRALITSLEDRVRARTDQLRTSAEVGRATTSILDTDQLLTEAVNLITNRFGFYYAAIFTLDEAGKIAVLREATGEAGRTLKEQNHQLVVTPQSMVGSAILTQQARIALDVGQGATRFANPLLPNTRSEIALPLTVGDHTIGALDVQSTEANAFDEASAEVLQTVADQLAVALINAQTLGRAEQQARGLARLNQLSRELALAPTLEAIGVAATNSLVQTLEPHRINLVLTTGNLNQLQVYTLYANGRRLMGQDQLVEVAQTVVGEAFRRGETINIIDLGPLVNQRPAAATLYAEGGRSLLVVPLRVGNRVLGTLNISRAVLNGFTPDNIAQVEQVAAQLAVTLENYNLAEQTRATLQELDAANRRLVGQAWERYAHASETLTGEWRDGQWVTSPHLSISTINTHGLAVPIKVRGETIGEFSVQTDDQRAWTPDEVAFAQTLIDQVGQVIENARLLEETERFAQREQRIRQITNRIRAASDVQAVLQATTTELAQALGVSRAIMRLTMGDADTTGNRPRSIQEPAA